jgi:hypothetical protein
MRQKGQILSRVLLLLIFASLAQVPVPLPIGDNGKSAACLGVPAAKVPTSFDELRGGTRGETQTSQFQKDTSASPLGFEARAAACSRRLSFGGHRSSYWFIGDGSANPALA